jgi:hypothetical protein
VSGHTVISTVFRPSIKCVVARSMRVPIAYGLAVAYRLCSDDSRRILGDRMY